MNHSFGEVPQRSAPEIERPKPYERFSDLKQKTGLEIVYVEEDDGSTIVSLVKQLEPRPGFDGSSQHIPLTFDSNKREEAGLFYEEACHHLKDYATNDVKKDDALAKMSAFFESKDRA
jgi:hypothetical protein